MHANLVVIRCFAYILTNKQNSPNDRPNLEQVDNSQTDTKAYRHKLVFAEIFGYINFWPVFLADTLDRYLMYTY